MMDDNYILFEEYLTNTITKEERIRFEEKLKRDTSFREDFNLYKNTSSFLENKFKNEEKLNEFKRNLQKISSNKFQKKKNFKIWKYGAVASILLLVGTLFFRNDTPNYNDIVTYETVELTVRSTQNNNLSSAEKAYNSKDFTTAIIHFDAILKETPNNSEIKLYKGFSLIELNQFDEAKKILQPIINGTSVFKTKATWYLALSNLKQNKQTEALEYLKNIPKSADEYSKANKLMNKLR